MNQEELLIRVRADIQEALTGLKMVQREIGGVGPAANRSSRSVNVLARGYQFLFSAASAYISLRVAVNLIKTADAYQVLITRIQTASRSLGNHVEIQRELETITRRNGTALSDTVSLFQRLSQAAPELRATADEMLRLTDVVQQIGIIGGSSPAQMSNALLQFGQMLSGGVARAQELNSLFENMPELALRLARGMGMTVGELRRAVTSGKVLSQDVFRAVLSQAGDVNREVRDMPDALARAGEDFNTSWSKALGTLDKLINGTSTLAKLIRQTSDILDGWATRKDPNARASDQIEAEIQSMLRTRDSLRASLREETGGMFGWLTRRGNQAVEQSITELDEKIAEYTRAMETFRRAEADFFDPATPTPDLVTPPVSDEEQKRLDSIEKINAALEDQAATLSLTEKEIARYRLAQLGATQADMERAEMALDMAAEQQRIRNIKELISSLQEEAATTGMTAEQVAVYRLSLLGASAAEIDLAREAARTATAVKEHQDEIRAGKAIIDATRTAQEQFNATVAEAVRLYQAGAFGAVGSADAMETLRRAVVSAQQDLAALSNTGKGAMDELTAAAKGWGDAFADTIADMAISGKASFSDLATAIIRDLIRIAAYMQIVRPILQHFGVIETPVQGLAGGGAVRGPGGPTSDSVPILASNGEFVMRAAAVRHYGEGFMARLNALNAPRFATGGLVRLASLPRFAAGGPVTAHSAAVAPASVEVSIDNRGQPARVRSATAEMRPDRMVVGIVLEDLDRNGPITQRLSNTFGLRR